MAVSSSAFSSFSKEVADSADDESTNNSESQLSQSLRPQRNRTKPKRFAIEDSIQDEESSSSSDEEEQISQKENISLQTSGNKKQKSTSTNQLETSHSNLQLEFSPDNSATFIALSHSKCNIQVLCDDLIGDFLGGREKKCIYELVSLLFNAGGSKFICFQDFTKEDVVAVEAIEFIQERILQCSKDEDENLLLHEFPFESKDRETKRFPKAFSDFWSIFIQRAFSSILMHDSLLPLLFDWACAMTSCKYRHFRFVATVAVFGIVSGLAKGIAFHQSQLEICQKLKASASKKRGRKAALASLDEVQASSSIAFGQNQIYALLDAVFIHRIRDVDPKIRKEAIFSLSQWICTLPAAFNEHLTILAPSLADEKAPVREATLEALIQISNVPESQNSIREFLSFSSGNCKQRLIDICLYDLSNAVKVLALQLVSILICDLKIVSLDQEFEKLKMLIFHSSQQVRQACFPIMKHYIEANWTLSIEGLCSFLQSVDRCNSGEIIFPFFKQHLSVGALREKLEQIAGAGGMHVKVILDFLAAALKDSSEASKTLSVDSFVGLMQITKEHSNSILNVLLSMDSALWAERLDVLKVQVLPQLFSFITSSCSWETIRKSIEVLYSLTQNPLLTASIQGQKEAFVSQLTAELAAFCSENHRQDFSSQDAAASVQSCCWRVECLCEWEHVPVDFLRVFLENFLSVADVSPVHHLQEPILISCMKALLKSHLHLNAFKLPDSIFDLCFLVFSTTSWPKLQASLASMLADHFIFAQNCDSLLVERIRQVLTQQLRLMSSSTENNTNEKGESMMMIEESRVFTLIKLMVFEMIPAKDSLKEIVAYLAIHEARWSDRLEALFGCSLKRLLSHSQAFSKQIAISLLDALAEAFLLSQTGALKIGQMVVDNLKLNLMWFFGHEAFVEFMQKILFSLNDDNSSNRESKSKIFSAFEMATPFVQFLGREQCSRIIELLNDKQQQFSLESKQQQSQWNEFVAKLKSRMLKKAPSGGKRGRKPKASSSLAISNVSSSLSDDEAAVREGEIVEDASLERSVEEEEENPFASSPMLPPV